jgi:hypothetical protein
VDIVENLMRARPDHYVKETSTAENSTIVWERCFQHVLDHISWF